MRIKGTCLYSVSLDCHSLYSIIPGQILRRTQAFVQFVVPLLSYKKELLKRNRENIRNILHEATDYSSRDYTIARRQTSLLSVFSDARIC